MTTSQDSDRPGAVLQRAERVVLRRPTESDAEEYLRLVAESTSLHHPWVYLVGTCRSFLDWVERSGGERDLGCLVCRLPDGAIVGVANLSEIVRGPFQSAYLSFYGRAGFEGRGLVREGVGLLLRHAFTAMGLHRVEANVQPGNLRSLALVAALGFRREGLSPQYLKIGGEWRDHERWAILADEWREPGSRSGSPGSDRRAVAVLGKVISGGQTGVDRAALEAARAAGLEIGGWCPPGRASESGPIPPDLPLVDTPEERSREAPEVPRSLRTEWNVRDADATLVLRPAAKAGGSSDPGTDWAARCAARYGRPHLEVDPADPAAPEILTRWLAAHAVETLNVAGPSEGTCPGLGARARTLLGRVFARV